MDSAASAADSTFKAVLAAWGPRARLGERLSGGNRNDVRLVHIDGRRWVGRLSLRPAPALVWELRLLDYLRNHGVRVPATLPAGDGRRLVDGLIVFEWLDGEPPVTSADWERVCGTLDRIHDLTRGWRQRPGFRSASGLLRASAGGDVRLDLMPADAVRACHLAWRPLACEPRSVVHSDPGASNIRISRDGVGLFDWDEARVDASLLDLAALPLERLPGVSAERLAAARRALDAWEAANGWVVEPDYARRRLAALDPERFPYVGVAAT